MNIKEIDRMLILEKSKYSFLFYAETILISNCFLFINDVFIILYFILSQEVIIILKLCSYKKQFEIILFFN